MKSLRQAPPPPQKKKGGEGLSLFPESLSKVYPKFAWILPESARISPKFCLLSQRVTINRTIYINSIAQWYRKPWWNGAQIHWQTFWGPRAPLLIRLWFYPCFWLAVESVASLGQGPFRQGFFKGGGGVKKSMQAMMPPQAWKRRHICSSWKNRVLSFFHTWGRSSYLRALPISRTSKQTKFQLVSTSTRAIICPI